MCLRPRRASRARVFIRNGAFLRSYGQSEIFRFHRAFRLTLGRLIADRDAAIRLFVFTNLDGERSCGSATAAHQRWDCALNLHARRRRGLDGEILCRRRPTAMRRIHLFSPEGEWRASFRGQVGPGPTGEFMTPCIPSLSIVRTVWSSVDREDDRVAAVRPGWPLGLPLRNGAGSAGPWTSANATTESFL